jgi:hypothetical protein
MRFIDTDAVEAVLSDPRLLGVSDVAPAIYEAA